MQNPYLVAAASPSRWTMTRTEATGEVWRTRGVRFGSPLVAACCGSVYSAYGDTGSLPVVLAVGVLLLGSFFCSRSRQLRVVDWSVLLVLAHESAASFSSRYSANAFVFAKTLAMACTAYFLVRLATITQEQCLIASLLVASGGVCLARFALVQFSEHFHELQSNALADPVAFRNRLIAPPSPWVLGEWFTLVLMTLPFAFAVAVYLCLAGRRRLGTLSLVPSLTIAAALTLSCSRAVFWGLALFFVGVFALGAVYRIFSIRTAGAGIVGCMCALGVLVLSQNVIYPGVMGAYTGRHTSQARSTEGRLAIWKRSADVFKLSPLWGVGSGNAPLFLAASADEDQTTGFASRTFSLPIQVLTEKGAVGAALYLAVLVLAGWEAHRKLRNPKVSLQMKGLTCCLMAGVMAVLFRELTYSSLLEHAATAMLFAMSLALIVSLEPV